MTEKIGLLYVKNTKTLQPISQEIKSLIGEKQRVVDAGVDEGKIITGKLTSVAKSIGKDLELASSLIVITDNVFWDTFWKEPSNKIQNKLEELLGDDDEDEGIDFILVVVCYINQLLLPTCFPSFAQKVTGIGENEEYLRNESKVYQLVVTMDNNTPDIINRLAKEIVDTFSNLNCCSTSKDQVDTITPVQTPIHSIQPKFPRVEIENQGRAPYFYLNTTDEDENLTDSGVKINVNTICSGEKHENENAYPLESPGLCLYIGVFEFESKEAGVSLQHRRPSAHELKIMRNCFGELGCFVKKKLNPTAKQTKDFLQEAIKWCGKLNPSYVVLIISTHGQEVSIAIKEDKSESTEQHPSGITGQKKPPRTEMVYQLFFQDGTSLFTRDIVRMFDRGKCPALKGKPCFYFIQSCRSRFGLDGHENFDPGVMVNVLTAEEEIRAGLKNPGSVDASGDTSHLDKTDAKKSTRKQTEEDKEARIKQIQEWLQKENLHTKILDYTAFLVKVNPPTSTQEAQKTDEKMVNHLSEILLAEGLLIDQVTEINEKCQGLEQEILDFFFPEPIISDPPPCVNDTLVMFASAPGKEAYNRDNQGGWLIKNLETQLNETLKTDPEKIDLLAELTKVSWRIAYKYETDTYASESSGHKSVPCLYHRLSKDVVIWPEKIREVKDNYEKDEKLKDFLKWIESA